MSDQADNLRQLALAHRQWRALASEEPAPAVGERSEVGEGAREPGTIARAFGLIRSILRRRRC